jgi:hypothetical protein
MQKISYSLKPILYATFLFYGNCIGNFVMIVMRRGDEPYIPMTSLPFLRGLMRAWAILRVEPDAEQYFLDYIKRKNIDEN